MRFTRNDVDTLRALANRLPIHADRASLRLIASKISFHVRSEHASPEAQKAFKEWVDPAPPPKWRRWWQRWFG